MSFLSLSDFDFDLPEQLIAQTPAKKRDHSRLLVLDRATGKLEHDKFNNLPRYLQNHPLMIFNDTRVLPVKLEGYKKGSNRQVELLLIREVEPDLWEGLLKGLGKMNVGSELKLGNGRLTAVYAGRKEEFGLFKLNYEGNLQDLLDQIAQMPLPPYIHRIKPDEDTLRMDRERYQTVYARHSGAIAAPTAGLHFTNNMLDTIRGDFADTAYLTLHVGPGTFQPIREERITNHKMKKEQFRISKDTWNSLVKAKSEGVSLLAVGTTTTRVLESVKLNLCVKEDVTGWTDRFLYPGQRFENVDQLLTNFHLPKSTLYLLVCAFAGKDLIQKAYQEAITRKYRFFSYGDAMLIL